MEIDAPSLHLKRFRVRPLVCKMDLTHIAIAAPSPFTRPPNLGATALIQRQKCAASFGFRLIDRVLDLEGISNSLSYYFPEHRQNGSTL